MLGRLHLHPTPLALVLCGIAAVGMLGRAAAVPVVDTHVHLTNVSLFNYTCEPALNLRPLLVWCVC
jgi:hypothetical protein